MIKNIVVHAFIVLSLLLAHKFFNDLAELRNYNADQDLAYLVQFDAQPKADRIRICKAVMQTKKLKERK